jgi:PAS domain S-box-containing protein
VIGRSGEVRGALLFAHDQPGFFGAEIEDLVVAIAGHAAIAIDNAELMRAANVEIERRRQAERAEDLLAAIVTSSSDAIVSKDLNGVIATWNQGAQRLFGYTAEEIVGKPVTLLIPAELQDEEPRILERIRRGERIEHFETIRRRKDGSLVDISLTVSPVRDRNGIIVGASKIARDISERKRDERQRELLVAELSHRVKNTLATVMSIAQQSFSTNATIEQARRSFEGRIRALAQTHSRLAETNWSGVLLETVVLDELAPYQTEDSANVVVSGPPLALNARSAVSLGMAFHELATNAAKYGALSVRSGQVAVEWTVDRQSDLLSIHWRETGGPHVQPPERRGFGRLLLERALTSDLKGVVDMRFAEGGLDCTIALPIADNVTSTM